ncbi:MAG: alanine--glyoxylate aminotransferase [Spirochaetes bacterium]|nr:MAG: alanine--glyoxylate aminotransferase [Spirochaetota bacterium]
MGPGPSCVAGPVYDALGVYTLGHLDPYFIKIMDEIKVLLRKLMKTNNRLTIPVSGTGSAGMEACFVNLIEPGDEVLILINGVFGTRMKDVATRLGAEVDTLEFEWGKPVEPAKVEEKLKGKTYKIVAVVHAETSTGVRNPVKNIGKLLEGKDSLFLVDTVTSLGGINVDMDGWGVDAMYSGTQKCLSCPPGLSPVSFSERALEVIMNRKTKVPNWYLDMSMIVNYWEGNKRAYHHTAPINMLYALYQALLLIIEEGMDSVFNRHLENHTKLVKGLENMGLEMLVEPRYRLPMLNSVKIPAGTDDGDVRSRLRNEHKIEIGAGLGPLAGKIWRIGLMGHTAREENVERFLKALKEVLKR